ncbi:hypothetical protein [Burkholderia ubonensis]|nr:hypothetical protein [Burkholderia ubonensis]
MSRYRWLQADWPMPVRTLAKQIRQRSFSDDESSGFILDRVRDDFLEARYVERYEYEETVSDPFGKALTFNRLEFHQTSFRAAPEWPGLELVDAPRSTQSLVSQLLEIADFALSIAPLMVDVMTWANVFQEHFGSRVVIDSIQLGALHIDKSVRAKVMLKGEEDVRSACKELIAGRKHVLEKLQFRVARGDLRTAVLIANNAAVRIDGNDLHDDVLVALRNSLPKQAC